MLKDSMTLEHLTPEDIAAARSIMLKLLKNDDQIPQWTDKCEVRDTGCAIHIKYKSKATVRLDGTGSSNAFVHILLKSPDLFWTLLAKLFAVGDDDMAALLDEARASG
jgi:hypothetical protein